MSASLILMSVTAGLTAFVAVMRRRMGVSALVASIGSGLLALFALSVPLDNPFVLMGIPLKIERSWSVLGRSLILDESNRAAVGFLYLAAAFMFGGGWKAQTGSVFMPIGLASVGMVGGSLLIRPFLFAAVFLELAAMGGVLLLASHESPIQRGSMRLLTFYTFAMMSILLTGWMLENVGVTSATPALARRVTVFLGLGFALIMAVPPFHLWLPAAAEKSNPYALTFVTVIMQTAGLFFLLRFLDAYAWLRDNPGNYQAIRIVGVVMVITGGMWAMAQTSLSKTVAYGLLSDFGVSLLALGVGTREGYQLSLGLAGIRVIGLSTWALGAVVLRKGSRIDDASALSGSAYRVPVATAGAIVGALSVAGFPLTAGFPGRWALLSKLAQPFPWMAAVVVVGWFLNGSAILRWGITMLSEEREGSFEPSRGWERSLLLGGVGLCFTFGAFPQLIYPWVVQALNGLTNLVP